MKETVTKSNFIEAFREVENGNVLYRGFSYDGLAALFDYFEEYEESCDTQIEFDMTGICCEYKEYDDFEELQYSYDHIDSMDDLLEHTQVIEIPGTEGFIIAQF